ncbi:MAG: porin [Acidobacteria bacterium]|nr:porin [Acidobacteriota bacterium]
MNRYYWCLSTLAVWLSAAAAGIAQTSSSSSDATPPPDPPKGYWHRVKLYGLIDGNYNRNFSDPASKVNSYRNFDIRTNTVDINYGELAIETPVEPIGFRADFGFGRTTQIVHGAEQAGQAFRYIQQAYVSAKPWKNKGLQFDFGKFVTSAGAEVIESHSNWNYSRSLLFSWAIPYYHMGLRTTIPVNKNYTAGVHLVNGWNNVKDTNGAKTVGLTGALTVGKVSWFHTYHVGREKPDIDGVSQPGLRNLFDTTLLVAPTASTAFYINFDVGSDKRVGPGSDRWYGIAGAARFALNKRLAFAPRVEWFKDRDGFATGSPQSLKEVTLTGEYKIWGANGSALLSRIEYRRDWSDQAVFDRARGQSSVKDQNTALVSLIFYFAKTI